MSQDQIVAIVDDDRSVGEALADLLEVEGYAATTFEDGQAFLASVNLNRVACVITDLRMPNMDGLELQHHLRVQAPLLPVIFITSSTDETLQARAIADGALAWLTKPVSGTELLTVLGAALHGAARHDAGPQA